MPCLYLSGWESFLPMTLMSAATFDHSRALSGYREVPRDKLLCSLSDSTLLGPAMHQSASSSGDSGLGIAF